LISQTGSDPQLTNCTRPLLDEVAEADEAGTAESSAVQTWY
jgi:hypothetical protein